MVFSKATHQKIYISSKCSKIVIISEFIKFFYNLLQTLDIHSQKSFPEIST